MTDKSIEGRDSADDGSARRGGDRLDTAVIRQSFHIAKREGLRLDEATVVAWYVSLPRRALSHTNGGRK